MELTEKELDNVLAGTSQEYSEEKALDNKELYRKEQIEVLNKQREIVENIKKEKTEEQESTFKLQ